ncbi:MAG: metallophosphoesterase [Cyanobacteria bacterium J06623_7]
MQIVPVQLTIPHLARTFDGFKVVQISDLHTSRFMPEERLTRIFRLVNQQHADAIAITGDIITMNQSVDGAKLQQQLSQLHSRSATLAVLGNHDHSSQINTLKQALAQSQIQNLDNQVFVIERGGQKLAFAGLDDPYWGQPNLEQILSRLPEGTPAIFLVHEPDYIEQSAQTHKFALQLSGHSHGGQVKIPFLDPLILPRGGRKYFAGLNQVEDTVTYTNRGLGMTNLPLRFGSRPEITVFTLHSPA